MGKHILFSAPLLALLSITVFAGGCSEYGSEKDPIVSGPSRPAGEEGPKAPPVQGTPQSGELVETLGVFVTPNGSDAGDGTRTRPFATIQHGIDVAKKIGKRVYVCAGSFSESLELADSISVIGGLDCSQLDWKLGAADARSKVTAPKSPAISARAITSATRISGLDVVAPNATDPSGSSIGLFAEKSPGIVVASSSITAGDGAKGSDGADGVQLNQSAAHDGQAPLDWAECNAATCKRLANGYEKIAGTGGSISACGGSAAQNGEKGGDGGSGGLWVARQPDGVTYVWQVYFAKTPEAGGSGTSAVGAAGTDGVPAALAGGLGVTGYAPADGNSGTDGQPGKGGAGGAGTAPALSPSAALYTKIYRGISGAGGGGGGCPGLAGQAGKGGGASIAMALVDSPIVVEDVVARAGKGGAAGLGTFGGAPRRGGAPNGSADFIQSSKNGGNGGIAGTSSNGSAGPSFGVAHVGAAPTLKGTTKVEQGQGGAGVDARSQLMGVGGNASIAATPAGLSEAIHAF